LGATQSCSSALRNAAEIQSLLKTAAADLSARGVVVLHVHTNERGQAGEILVSRSSGVTALDAAAVRIAARMVFHPALNDGIPVAVWTEIPVVFN
jgi:protein TonB